MRAAADAYCAAAGIAASGDPSGAGEVGPPAGHRGGAAGLTGLEPRDVDLAGEAGAAARSRIDRHRAGGLAACPRGDPDGNIDDVLHDPGCGVGGQQHGPTRRIDTPAIRHQARH